ncbi:MAG: hypothetical protein GX248_10300 [Peptococcaceae bacterium]|nr:hypothetical protein [Peptococcaceae bacterium]
MERLRSWCISLVSSASNNLVYEYSNPLMISCPVATTPSIKQTGDTACEFAVQHWAGRQSSNVV